MFVIEIISDETSDRRARCSIFYWFLVRPT